MVARVGSPAVDQDSNQVALPFLFFSVFEYYTSNQARDSGTD